MAESPRRPPRGRMNWVVIAVAGIVAVLVVVLLLYDRQPEVPSTAEQPRSEQPAVPAPQAPTNPAPERPPNSTR